MLLGVGVLLAVCLVVGLLLGMAKKPKNTTSPASVASQDVRQPAKVCASDIIGRASTAIRTNDLSLMESIKAEILSLKDYKNDINCSYIRAHVALMTGSVSDGESALQDLQWAYGYGSRYSTEFDPPAEQPQQIESFLTDLKERQATQKAQRMNSGDDEGK